MTSRWAVPVAVAAAMTAGNVAKPVHVDDITYVEYARHIADHPLDPYRFSTQLGTRPQAATRVLAPPLVPYWLAGAIRLTDAVAAWKLAMFPFDLLFTAGVYCSGGSPRGGRGRSRPCSACPRRSCRQPT